MSGATGPAQSITVPNPNQPLTNGNTVDRVWWRFFSSLAGLHQTAAASSDVAAVTSKVVLLQQQVSAIPPASTTPPPPDLSPQVSDLETEVALLMQRPYAGNGGGTTVATAPAIYAPLTNGDIPGPDAVADPAGQFIMTQIR